MKNAHHDGQALLAATLSRHGIAQASLALRMAYESVV